MKKDGGGAAAVPADHVVILEEGDSDLFRCVLQQTPGQLYFMLGFPAMVLTEIAACEDVVIKDECLSAARELVDWLKRCSGVFESPMAHKVARAAYGLNDLETSKKIVSYFLKAQQSQGNYQEDPEAMDSVDQTAEVIVWLHQVRDLL